MSLQKQPITKIGMENLIAEIKELESELPKAAEDISDAKSHGDLSENSEYKAAKEKQSKLFNRLKFLQNTLSNSYIFESEENSNDTVKFGSEVKVNNMSLNKEMSIKIVSEYESDFSKGFISCVSPVGSALLGKKVGDLAIINNGAIKYKILSIQ